MKEEKSEKAETEDKDKENGDVGDYVTYCKRREQMRQNYQNDGSKSPSTGTKKRKNKIFRKFPVGRRVVTLRLLTWIETNTTEETCRQLL
jgi:hypothetical protein